MILFLITIIAFQQLTYAQDNSEDRKKLFEPLQKNLEKSKWNKCYSWGWNAFSHNNSMNFFDQELLIPISGLK